MNSVPVLVAVLDDFQDVARSSADWARLEGRAEITFFTDNVRGLALIDRLQPFTVVVAIRERTQFSRTLLAQLPELRLIATTGMRNRGIDLAACRDRGIAVCGTEGSGTPTAELAMGLILALSRNIVAEDRGLRAGQWQSSRIGRVIMGKTLGLVGLGKLGSEVTRLAKAFGMTVLAWSPHLTEARAAAVGCRAVDKETLFRSSDYVSLHLVLSEATQGVVGAGEFAWMPRHACLVNTSRAGLVDQGALIAALAEGHIAGAAIDVFPREPLPADSPILYAPNTILTPHLGYATRESYDGYFPQVLENIEAWLAEGPIRLLSESRTATQG